MMELHVGETVVMRKPHPCGSRDWALLRVGADVRAKCCGCGHEMMLPRHKFETLLKKSKTQN